MICCEGASIKMCLCGHPPPPGPPTHWSTVWVDNVDCPDCLLLMRSANFPRFKFSPSQSLYRSLYATLSRRKRAGADVDSNQDSDSVLRRLWETWESMSEREREPFLAPGCLER